MSLSQCKSERASERFAAKTTHSQIANALMLDRGSNTLGVPVVIFGVQLARPGCFHSDSLAFQFPRSSESKVCISFRRCLG